MPRSSWRVDGSSEIEPTGSIEVLLRGHMACGLSLATAEVVWHSMIMSLVERDS